MKNLFRNGKIILSRKQTNILSAAMVIMTSVAISRLLGLLRDRLLAGTFFGGKEWQLDVYFAAFRIPEMIFQLFVLGALSAAFIPVFSEYLEKNKKEAYHISSTVINLLLLIFLFLSFLVFIFAQPLVRIITPTFTPKEIALMVNLVRLMLLAQLFFCFSNFLTSIIQSHQRFLVPALSPLAYNLGIILGIIFLAPFWGIYGPTIGVIIGAFLHLLIQIPLALKLGFRYFFHWNLHHPGVKEMIRLMLPRTLALAIKQVELTVTVYLATSLAAGSLSIFYFAQHLMNLPIGLFGATIGQAALPSLSKASTPSQKDQFKKIFLPSFQQIVYLTLPASIILLVLRIPLVRIVFGVPSFPWKATLLTGRVVAIFSLAVVAQALNHLLTRGFYALHNTQTPLLISALAVFLNVSLSFFLILGFHLGLLGLATATTTASFFQTGLLLLLIWKKIDGFEKKEFFLPLVKMGFATLLTGVALWSPMRLLDRFILDTTRTLNLILLTLTATFSGVGVYLLLSFLLKIKPLKAFIYLIRRVSRWQEVLQESEEMIVPER